MVSKYPLEKIPKSDFPYIPGYGKKVKDKKDLLSWSWAEEQISISKNYWISTVSRTLNPHIMPVWGIWFEYCFYFSTGVLSKKARNLRDIKNCAVSTEHPDNPVVLEGSGKRIYDSNLLKKFAELYNNKYNWSFNVKNDELIDELGNKGIVF